MKDKTRSWALFALIVVGLLASLAPWALGVFFFYIAITEWEPESLAMMTCLGLYPIALIAIAIFAGRRLLKR